MQVADRGRDEAETALRGAVREVEAAGEAIRRAEWLIEQRSESPDEGPDAVRRAELAAEVRGERRMAESALREHNERVERAARLRGRIERDRDLATAADSAAAVLDDAREAVAARVALIEAEHAAGAEAGERTAAELRSCAHQEAELQRALREASERVTVAEVTAQQIRDQAADADQRARRGRRAPRTARASPPPSRSTTTAAASSRPASTALPAAASSSARSTRWPPRSTRRRSPTSRSSRASAPTSRARSPSCRA